MLSSITLPWFVALIASLAAAVTDLRSFRISNRLTIPLLLAGPIYHSAVLGPQSLVLSGLGFLIATLLLLPLYCAGGMGAGDIKLMAGLGAWLGPALILKTLLVSCLLTGVHSAVVWTNRQNASSFQPLTSGRVEEAVARSDSRSLHVVPFGVAVALALPVTLAVSFF